MIGPLLALLVAAAAPGPPAAAPEAAIREAIAQGRFARAESLATVHLAATERTRGPRSLATAAALDLLVESLRRGERIYEPRAREAAWRAFAIRDSLQGPSHLDLAGSRLRLALALREAGDLAGARTHIEAALAAREAALGPDHPLVAEALVGLGNLKYRSGDYAGSRAAGERAFAIYEKTRGSESLEVAEVLNLLGAAAYMRQDQAAARDLYERGLAIREKRLPAGHPDLVYGYSGLGNYFYSVGDYERSRDYLERTLRLREATAGPHHPLVAHALSALGLTLRRMGRGAEARPLVERALAIYEQAMGPEHPQVATVLLNLAGLYQSAGDVPRARAAMERSLHIREKSLGPDHPELGIPLHNLALMIERAGDSRAARPYFERSIAVLARGHGPDHPWVAHVRGNYALTLARLGLADTALAQAAEAERASREQLRLTARRVSEREALGYAGVINSAQELGLSLAASGMLEPADLRLAWDVLIRSRTVVFDELAERRRVPPARAGREGARRDSLRASAAERLARLLLLTGGGEPRERIAEVKAARESLDRAERALAEVSASAGRSRHRSRLGFAEVAAALPAGSALVAFGRYERYDVARTGSATDAPGRIPGAPDSAGRPQRSRPEYLAWVLHGGSDLPSVVPLGAADSLDTAVMSWLDESAHGALIKGRAAGQAEAACRAAGEVVRRALWDPLAPALGKAARVFVVPDGALHFVNLGALPVKKGQYLVERGPLLHLLTSERDLVEEEVSTPPGRGLLALGGPAFDADPGQPVAAAVADGEAGAFRGARSRCEEFAKVSFPPLVGAAAEVRDIAALWRAAPGEGGPAPARVLTGAEADEGSFKRLAPGHRVLHLATHGYFLGGDCRGGGADARGIGGLTAPAAALAASESPLLFGGLALAGANRRGSAGPEQEDGLLSAEEIATLDLGGVGWAVLSACDTGAGALVADEGVLGLRRAFLVAGARTVLVSLWGVSDEPTRRWMTSLYRARLGRGLGTAEAVRAASLEVLQDRRASGQGTHPFYWAGFAALGDWR